MAWIATRESSGLAESPAGPRIAGRTAGAFSRLAIHSTDGETIFSVEVETASGAHFKEFKQVDFSPAVTSPVFEPASWAMMLLGFGGAGAALRSRRQLRTATL